MFYLTIPCTVHESTCVFKHTAGISHHVNSPLLNKLCCVYHLISRKSIPASGHSVQRQGQPGSGPGRSHGSQGYHLGQLLQQLGERSPQIGVVLLERLELVGVEAAVGVHMERRLIEIVGAPPLEGHQLPHRGEIHLGHTLLDLPLLLRRHHDVEMDGASASFWYCTFFIHLIPPLNLLYLE